MKNTYKLGSNQYITIPKSSKITPTSEFKRIIKESLKVVLNLFIAAIVIIGIYQYGSDKTSAQVVYASVPTAVMPTTISSFPILQKIADCESGTRLKDGDAKPNSATQFAPNGQVLTNPNTNHSVDIGIMQINLAAYGATATKLGYNLSTQSGNEAMGLWIYENRGTSDWYSSESCWQ